ncbi:MAG: hypothetical protein WAV22_00375 [Porticoccaceae bacterium]
MSCRALLAMCLALNLTAHAEPDTPPAGHSRFDELLGGQPVPYPFSRLVETINGQMRTDAGGLPALKITLIPLGRSLQRDAGAPDFFRFPRVVAAADGTNRPGFAPLRDRLFLGFQEQGEVVEVISYNDAAGRFEFQVVRDYAARKTPRAFYARRGLCLACHQNAAPIFARPLWDETPANPAIAARLRATGRDFYGVKITGTDIAYLIDAAADRANLFAVWQTLWREGCGADAEGDRCRREAFAAALDYATTLTVPAADALPALARRWASRWASRWPRGLTIPSADLPNRDPFFPLADPEHDPLRPRAPLAVWSAPDITGFVVGLAGMLDSALVERLRAVAPTGRSAALDRLLARGAFAQGTFGAAVSRALAGELGNTLARPGRTLPAPRTEPVSAPAGDAARSVYAHRCAMCHDTTLAHPPNFLHGAPAQVETRIDHCAERMYYRLNQAAQPEAARQVAPMPPPTTLGMDALAWLASADFSTLRDDLAARITRQGRDPRVLLRLPYTGLRACLPYAPSPSEHAHGPAL